jgi:hypothetical protein
MDFANGHGKTGMRRKWNWPIWIGFLFVLTGFFSYTFFARFPVTRDFPWANLVLFCAGGILLVVGLFRAFGNPRAYRGKIFGSILMVLSMLMIGLFSYVIFYDLRQVPASSGAPRVGQLAPDFLLLDQNGNPVGLGDLLRGQSGPKAVALIFYRGFW